MGRSASGVHVLDRKRYFLLPHGVRQLPYAGTTIHHPFEIIALTPEALTAPRIKVDKSRFGTSIGLGTRPGLQQYVTGTLSISSSAGPSRRLIGSSSMLCRQSLITSPNLRHS
ncbi:hypothetical protein KCV07_g250, partial [Aureobasidium melanogenum]